MWGDEVGGISVGDWVGPGSGRMDEPGAMGKMLSRKRPVSKSANSRTATVGASQLNVRPKAGRLKRERLVDARVAAAVRKAERPGRSPWGGGGVFAKTARTSWTTGSNSRSPGSKSTGITPEPSPRRSSKARSRLCSCSWGVILVYGVFSVCGVVFA